MMVFDGFSFSFFEGSGFRRSSSALQSQAGLVANRSKVVAWIDEAAARISSAVAAELQNRMFTISADIGSPFGHRILGVTAQFFDCGKVIHRVLAIMPLTNRHTIATASSTLFDALSTLRVDRTGISFYFI